MIHDVDGSTSIQEQGNQVDVILVGCDVKWSDTSQLEEKMTEGGRATERSNLTLNIDMCSMI
jgi:cellobiose-specific phosphotransferase system component IIB